MCDSHDFELVSRPTFEHCLDSLSAVRNSQLLHALLYAQLRGNAIDQSVQQKLETEALMQHVIQLLSTGHGQRDAVTLLDSKKFAVLLQDCFSECALQMARLLRTAIQNSMLWWQGNTLQFNVNIGLVLFRHYSDKATLLMIAHQACRSAKEQGHNHIHVVRLHQTLR